MDSLNNSKEELIQELLELKQAYNSLKENFETELLSYKLTEAELRASEERFQLLFNKAPLGYQSLDCDGKFIEVNQHWLDTLGYDRQEVIGKWFGNFLTPAFQDGFRQRFPVFKTQGHIHSEFEMVHKNGAILFIAFEGKIGYDYNGEFKQTHCILQDITERKQVEQKQIMSDRIFNHALDMLCIAGFDGYFKTLNPTWSKVLGYSTEELLEKPWLEYVYPDDREATQNIKASIVDGQEVYQFENRFVCKDGSIKWLSWNSFPYPNESIMFGVARDITFKKQAEIALAESKENLSITLHSIGDGVISTDLNGLIVQMNPVAEKLCGWKLSDALGKPLHEVFIIINAETRQTVTDPVAKVLKKGEIVGLANHTALISNDGTEHQIADSAAPIKNKEGKINGVVLVFSDVTEKYAAEKALKESEERFALVIDASEQGIWDWNIETNEVFYSEQWKKQIGYKDHELKNDFNTWIEHLHPDEIEYCQNAIYSYLKQPFEHFMLEFRFRHKDGTYRWIYNKASSLKNNEGKIIRMFGTHTDITERKKAEQELKRLEWLLTERPKVHNPQNHEYNQSYGNLVSLNTNRLILDSVGEQLLNDIVGDYLNLLDSSSAVYEKNGDYALGIFSSGWCRFMDAASRAMCNTNDNHKALTCGLWHCHESCWTHASKKAIETGQPTDIECNGGIRLYALPIKVGDEIVGAINFGYGEPPRDEKKLRELATSYMVSYDDLRTHALNYESRPPYIIELAKHRLGASARLIGEIIERKKAEESLKRTKKLLSESEQIGKVGGWEFNVDTLELNWTEETFRIHEVDLNYNHTVESGINFYTPDSKPIIENALKRAIEFKEPFDLELKIITAKGNLRYVHTIGKIDSVNHRIFGFFQDITERKIAEDKLCRSEENLSITLHSIGDGVISTDINGLIVNMNPVAEKLCGQKLTDASGKPLHEVFNIINAETRQKVANPVKKVLEKGEIVGLANHTVLISNDGTEYQIADSAAPIKNKDGHISGVVLVFSDVTEKYAAEIILKESEERFKALHNASFGGIAIHDKGKILECNQGLSEITGYSYTELIGMDGLMLIAPDTRDLVLSNILSGHEKPYEALGMRKNGEIFPLRLEARNIPYKGKKVRTVEFRDITESKLAEETLRKNEEMMLNSQAVAHICSYSTNLNETDLEKSYWVCSPEFYKIFGIDETYPHTIAGWAGFIHPDYREELVAYHEYVVKNRTSFNHEYKIIRINDGVERWVQGTGELVYDEQGNPIRMHGAIQDITERKWAEDALQKSEAIKNKMVSNIGDVIVIIDKDGINRYKSPNIEKWFGWKPEDLVGNSTWDIVHPEDLEASQKFIQSLAGKPNASGTIELRYRKKDETYCPIEITVVNLLQDPHIKGFLGNYHDISERKKTEQELIAAKEKAEESDRLKTAFLQNMSHEIRTPMNAIMGFSELLVHNYNNKPKLEKFSEIINLRCNDLLDLVNDILDIAKIESGQLSVNMEECNLNILFAELTSFFIEHQKRIGKQNIKFSLQALCEPSDTIVITDKVKLKQIFINLISNAFKFTEMGEIKGGCKFDEHQNFIFFVSDTGIGISTDKQQMIFERFAQVEQGSNRLYGGTGLGLSIVKGLVSLLGGEIFLESEFGKGSTFSFVISYKKSPVIQTKTIALEKPNDFCFSNKTILIVEDDIYNAEYLKEILSDKGLNIIHAVYGKESIKIATNQQVDLVLMDIQLPDIDGYESIRQIRKHKPHLKIIAQTAYAGHEEKQKAMDYGCVDYISKPTSQDRLLEMINKHLV